MSFSNIRHYDSVSDRENAPLLGQETAYYKEKSSVKRYMSCAILLVLLIILMLIATILLGLILIYGMRTKSQSEAVSSQDLAEITGLKTLLPKWPDPSSSPMGVYSKAAVAAENGICSEIGRNIMIRGGNVVDATIATVFCMGVMNPQHSGLGGGHFMTFFNRTSKECISIDAREVAPLKATRNMYGGKNFSSKIGWSSIAVPGELHGLWSAHKNYGRSSWTSLIQPTINLLEGGLPVSSALAEVLKRSRFFIKIEPSLRIFLSNKTGDVFKEGDVIKRPVLARTYRQIAESSDPVSLFYSGKIGKNIAAEFSHQGALITAADLGSYKSIIRKPILTKMSNGLSVCGPPPPSSAAVTHLIVNILSGYEIAAQNLSTVNGNVDIYHKFIEAMKFAYAEREELGDVDFIPNAAKIAQKLSTEAFVNEIRSKITDVTHSPEYYGPINENLEDHGTTTIVAIDSEENAVSLTSSINLEFGSQRRSENTGIIWNDSMDDFAVSIKPNAFGIESTSSNFIEPGKRPMSSMSPSIFFDRHSGDVRLVIGAAGGSKIISGVAYTAMRILLLNETVKEALDKQRLHNQLLPDYTEFETGFPQVYIDKLRQRGHKLKSGYSSISAVTSIERQSDGCLFANSDRRKGSASYSAGF